MNNDLIAKLRAIHVPTKEEVMAGPSDSYGLLFGEECCLRYLDFATQKTKTLATADAKIQHITTHDGDVFFENDSEVYSLNGVVMSSTHQGYSPLCSHNNHLLVGSHRVISAFAYDQELVSETTLKDFDISFIESLFTSPAGDLLALVQDKHGGFSIWSFTQDYSLKTILLQYSNGGGEDHYCQALALPYGSFTGLGGKEYDFSVLSCAKRNCLDINDEAVTGTQVEEETAAINRLAIRRCVGPEADVIYSGEGLGTILQAKIDLKKREVIGDIKELIPSPRETFALHLVRDYISHERIMRYEPNIYFTPMKDL